MINYSMHNHTYRCKHAIGSEEEMLIQGIKDGFKTFGLSDHMAYPIKHCYARMEYSEKEEYLSIISNLKEKYLDNIIFYRGFEAEYEQEYINHLIELFKDNKIDYLVLGQHYKSVHDSQSYFGRFNGNKHAKDYVDLLINGIESELFYFIAHPDIFLFNVDHFDEVIKKQSIRLIKKAIEYNIPLEYNAGGIRKAIKENKDIREYDYPRYEFWQLVKEYDALVIVNSDAHSPNQINDQAYQLACKQVNELKLKVLKDIDLSNYHNIIKKRYL